MAIILCEGTANGYDGGLLEKLFGNIARIVPLGSRFGMKYRIDTLRTVMPETSAFAILDRDFPKSWEPEAELPIPWTVRENVREHHYGWFWERKELENYFIDPIIVRKSLKKERPDWNDSELDHDYVKSLEEARNEIHVYQAARLSLSILGRSGQYYVSSSFGTPRGATEGYFFPKKDDLSESASLEWLHRTHEEYIERHTGRLDELCDMFRKFREETSPGGIRYDNYLSAFSGKDLAWAMENKLIEYGFQGTKNFLNLILKGILESEEDVSSWLPEWTQMKEAIQYL